MSHALRNGCSPLPEHWPYGPDRLRGERIDKLPPGLCIWALRTMSLPPNYRAALLAQQGLRQLVRDQQEGC